MAKAVGITGGIGSGKSAVCRVFQVLGIHVFDADSVAKDLYKSNQKIKNEMICLFGADIYTPEGNIDRNKLASAIFSDELRLRQVNELVHPAVCDKYHQWLSGHKSLPYVIHEAAILFESGFYKMMDFNILVSATEEQRIERVVKRDGISGQIVRERMKKQWPDEKKRLLADRELINDNSRLLIPEIIEIDKNLREHGKIW